MTFGFKDLLHQHIQKHASRPIPTEAALGCGPSYNPLSSRILDNAKKLFIANGYGSVTTDDIAASARVSKTTLYNHFSSKKELFSEVVKREISGFKAPFDPQELQDKSLEEAISHIAVKVIDEMVVSDKWRLEYMISSQMSLFPDLKQRLIVDLASCELNLFAEYICTSAENGKIIVDDCWFAAAYLLSLLKGYYCGFVVTGLLDDLSADDRLLMAQKASRMFILGVAKPI